MTTIAGSPLTVLVAVAELPHVASRERPSGRGDESDLLGPQLHREQLLIVPAIYWHERWQNEDTSYSNLRVNSSPESLQAYRQCIAHPYWIDRPIWKK